MMGDPMAVSPPFDPAPAPQGIVTLRTLLSGRQSKGERFKLGEVVAIVVPICTELAQLHAKGEAVFVHPGSIGAGPDGVPRLVPQLAKTRPTAARDLAAIAPELQKGSAPTTRSSVFSLGAIVYEMLTLTPIGPGMKPPSQVLPGIPPIVDTILSKALLTDAAQRPDDLAAFAQAIHHFAPASIAPPPMADDHAFDVDVDMRGSMLPMIPIEVDMAPAAAAPVSQRSAAFDDPFAVVAAPISQQRTSSPSGAGGGGGATEELNALKDRLEADPAPRWMMVKDKMDHGPFAAIELLQMIASNRFTPTDILVDTHSNKRTALKEHPEFSRFAHHAELKRENIKEVKAVAQAERSEKAAGATKATLGIALVVAVIAVIGVVVWRIKAGQDDEEKRKRDEAMSLAGEGSIKAAEAAKQKPKWTGGAGGGGGGGGGKSYEDALKNSVSGSEDEGISISECSAVGGGIAAGCGLNGSATAKFMVQKGRVQGVSVTTNPSQPGVEACMRGAISGVSFRNMPAATGCIRTFKAN